MNRTKTVILGLSACSAVWLAASFASHGATPDAGPPAWAFAGNPKPTPATTMPPSKPGPITVPGSKLSFATPAEVRDLFNPPDWHPEDHPAMPTVVSHGRRPGVFACGYCHLPNGQGRPENVTLAGLSANYIVRQVADFKSGARTASIPHRGPIESMTQTAKSATDEEIAQAATYFASLRSRPVMKVTEAANVPKTFDKAWIQAFDPNGGREPLGDRIVEAPVSFERFERRDGRVPILVYVPVGSIAKGKALATDHSHRPEVACATCHGARLEGVGDIPPLAGRSPSYIARQLYDFKTGARAGEMAGPMKDVAEHLTPTDVVNVSAYLASLK